MSTKNEITLSNKTVAKLAIAIATANSLLIEDGEVIGPLTRKVLATLDSIDSLEHFNSHNS
jgi:hypothetical protein